MDKTKMLSKYVTLYLIATQKTQMSLKNLLKK